MCVCVCVCACMCACMCACVCVWTQQCDKSTQYHFRVFSTERRYGTLVNTELISKSFAILTDDLININITKSNVLRNSFGHHPNDVLKQTDQDWISTSEQSYNHCHNVYTVNLHCNKFFMHEMLPEEQQKASHFMRAWFLCITLQHLQYLISYLALTDTYRYINLEVHIYLMNIDITNK